MNAALHAHIVWKLDICTFMLPKRLVSEHAVIRQYAATDRDEAALLRSLLNTPSAALNAVQQVWMHWCEETLEIYQQHYRTDDYRVLCVAAHDRRNERLAKGKAA
jgi:hypothetical protein